MPKKRHQARFSKPQSTAPAALRSSSSLNHIQGDHSPGVNELLAGLRRGGENSNAGADVQQMVAPSMPPMIRDMLQLPVLPAPRPRQTPRAQQGRRQPAGPAPPQSWLAMSRHAPAKSSGAETRNVKHMERRTLPDAYLPGHGSMVDMLLRRFASTWDFQSEYWRYYIHDLPTHLRVALVMYLAIWSPSGVSKADLQIILQPQKDDDAPDDEPVVVDEYDNVGFEHLDLTGCLGRSIRLPELSSLLFPSKQNQEDDLQETWDEPADGRPIYRPLLPRLTHLSLSIDPEQTSAASWRHLLSFATHLPTLTHLSLAYWPEPTLTPNAKYATVVSAEGRSVQYGGTGPYSHTLDGDWAEAVVLLRRLSKALYGLEYLDLTGCAEWCQALFLKADHAAVDWVGTWGKIETLVLQPGRPLPPEEDVRGRKAYRMEMQNAERVEKHIRTQRAGRGHFITVEKAPVPEISIDDLFRELGI